MRNVHYLQLGLKQKDAKDTGMILVARHAIDAIIPHDKGTTILMNSGVAYEVVETFEDIKKKLQTSGIGQIL